MYIEDEVYPYRVVTESPDSDNRIAMWKWCCEQWGRPRYGKPCGWYTSDADGRYMFLFKNEADRNWCMLRWA